MTNHHAVDQRRARIKAAHERKTSRKPRRATASSRGSPGESSLAIEDQPWIAEAIAESKDHGLTLHVTAIRGRGAGLHFHWKLSGVHVADYWPTDGRLDIGGRSHWPEDVSHAIRIIVEQINIT